VLVAVGYPLVSAAIEARGRRVVPLEVSEFRKMDGGLSCLSLRF
jgi:dimethylargininase